MNEPEITPREEEEHEPHTVSLLTRGRLLAIGGFLSVLCTLFLGAWYISVLNQPSDEFPVNELIVIESGMEVRAITELLEEYEVVKSGQLLYYVLAFSYDPTAIKASTYIFESPLTTTEVARRLTEGDFDTDLVRFIHFEGERTSAIAERATQVLPEFDKERFLANTEEYEGTLFPDTYFIPATFTDEELLVLLQDTYEEKIAPLRPNIEAHPLSEEEIIILASIIEREANTPESMRRVASVFLNRLEAGMPLQADASIEYVIETPLGELPPGELAENLRELESPYNTYLYPGLPPGPIGNPGLDSITAILEPAETEYFYYLTADDGTFYYAETYDEHLTNIERYLR